MLTQTKKTSDYTRYSVSLSATSRKESILLGKDKKKRIVLGFSRKITAMMAIIMIMMVGNIGLATAAVPASAATVSPPGGIGDIGEGIGELGDKAKEMAEQATVGAVTEGFNRIFCSAGPSGYKVNDKNILSPKGDGKLPDATPYEKYGMAGLNWSVWIGFAAEENSISDKEGKGKGSSIGIINKIGGNANQAGLTQWESAYGKKIDENPGMFNTSNECSTFSARNIPTGLGNMMLGTATTVTWISGQAYESAHSASSNIYKSMEKPVTAVVDALLHKLYFQFLTPMIMVAALWMGWVGLVKRRTTEFTGGLIWLICAIVASVAFMSNPMAVPKMMNTVVTGISQTGMNAITSSTVNPDEDICKVLIDENMNSNQQAKANIRGVQCNLWYAFGYTPWTVGQFGSTPQELTEKERVSPNGFIEMSGKNSTFAYREKGLDLNTLNDSAGNRLSLQHVKIGDKVAPASEQNWALYLLDHKVDWEDGTEPAKVAKIREQLHVTANQLAPSDYNSVFRGDAGETRIAMGGIAMLASLGAGIMIIVVSVSLIVLDIGVIIMTLISPIFFLAALHPGAGRRIAMGWVESLLKMALKRIALSIYLAVMISIFSVMIQSSQEMGWVISMILIVAIAIGGLTYQKQISEMFNGFSLGGKEMQKQEIIGKGMAQEVGGSALNAVTGGFIGGGFGGGKLGGSRQKSAGTNADNSIAGAGVRPAPKSTKPSDSSVSSDQQEKTWREYTTTEATRPRSQANNPYLAENETDDARREDVAAVPPRPRENERVENQGSDVQESEVEATVAPRAVSPAPQVVPMASSEVKESVQSVSEKNAVAEPLPRPATRTVSAPEPVKIPARDSVVASNKGQADVRQSPKVNSATPPIPAATTNEKAKVHTPVLTPAPVVLPAPRAKASEPSEAASLPLPQTRAPKQTTQAPKAETTPLPPARANESKPVSKREKVALPPLPPLPPRSSSKTQLAE